MYEQWLVVTDLDGTLLNHHDYDFSAALPMLQRLESAGIPVILNTSKTLAELRQWVERLHNRHPFIAENGSAIYIPQDYFDANFRARHLSAAPDVDGYHVWVEGVAISDLRDFLLSQAPTAISFVDCSEADAIALTGLTTQEVRLARDRQYSIPLVFDSLEAEVEFSKAAELAGFGCLRGGRFLHLQGPCNKGSTMQELRKLYQSFYKKSVGVIALGDNHNDLAMLEQADIPVVVRSPSGHAVTPAARSTIYTQQLAPRGWVEGVQRAMPTFSEDNLQEMIHGG